MCNSDANPGFSAFSLGNIGQVIVIFNLFLCHLKNGNNN